MIAFPCPRCGVEVRVGDEHAGLLVCCLACGEKTQAPNAAITDAPTDPAAVAGPTWLPGAVVRPTPARGPYEDVYYDDGKALVCETQLIIGRRVYPLRHVVRLETMDAEEPVLRRRWVLIVGGPGCVAVLYGALWMAIELLDNKGPPYGLALTVGCWLVAWFGFVACLRFYSKKVALSGIGLVEKSGYVEEIWFRNRARRAGVFKALSQVLGPVIRAPGPHVSGPAAYRSEEGNEWRRGGDIQR